MIRKWIYFKFAKIYIPKESSPLLKAVARFLEIIFGYAIFNYGGIKLTAGPYAYLDHHIIRGNNINPYVTSALSQYLSDGGVFLDIGANHGIFFSASCKKSKNKSICV